MNDKVIAAIERFSMFSGVDTVTVAVSGGADSVALLDFLCARRDELGISVGACHLNHCLRGDESERDEQFVRTMCAQYGVPLEVGRVEVRKLAGESGMSIETAARKARYEFFDSVAKKTNGRIATAHTLSDVAETVLLNLARGTGITGMCGIPPVRGVYVRPFIDCTRGEIEQYCASRGVGYVTDSTNLTSDYTRNHIRHNIMPHFERVNPDTLGAVRRMTELLRDDADYLRGAAQRETEEMTIPGGLDAKKLRESHPAVRSRIIAGMLKAQEIECSAERVERIERLLLGEKKEVQVGKRRYVNIKDGALRIEKREKLVSEPIEPLMLHKASLDGLKLAMGGGKIVAFSVIDREDCEISDNNCADPLKNAADYDRIGTDIFLRAREAGDTIRPAGRGCTKKLKKLFSELALADRERLCVIADGDGVFFAEQVGADERVKVDGRTKNVLTVTFLSDI